MTRIDAAPRSAPTSSAASGKSETPSHPFDAVLDAAAQAARGAADGREGAAQPRAEAPAGEAVARRGRDARTRETAPREPRPTRPAAAEDAPEDAPAKDAVAPENPADALAPRPDAAPAATPDLPVVLDVPPQLEEAGRPDPAANTRDTRIQEPVVSEGADRAPVATTAAPGPETRAAGAPGRGLDGPAPAPSAPRAGTGAEVAGPPASSARPAPAAHPVETAVRELARVLENERAGDLVDPPRAEDFSRGLESLTRSREPGAAPQGPIARADGEVGVGVAAATAREVAQAALAAAAPALASSNAPRATATPAVVSGDAITPAAAGTAAATATAPATPRPAPTVASGERRTEGREARTGRDAPADAARDAFSPPTDGTGTDADAATEAAPQAVRTAQRAAAPSAEPAVATVQPDAGLRAPAAAGLAARPAPAAPQAPALDALLDKIRVHARPGVQRIAFEVEPPELGRVAIRLTMRGDRLVGEIRADSQAVARVLGEGIEAVRQSMARAGIEVDALDVRTRGDDAPSQQARHEAFDQARGGHRDRRPAGNDPQATNPKAGGASRPKMNMHPGETGALDIVI